MRHSIATNKGLLALGLWLGTCGMALGSNTRARLALPAETVRPGETITAGVVLEMTPPWHTYWRNPGESGMATAIQWKLPDGVKAGAIQWPVPEEYDSEDLVTYILHGTAVLLVPLEFSADLQPGPLNIEAKVSWLECDLQCVPGDATVQASITVADATTPSKDAGLISDAQSQLPKDGASLKARAAWDGPVVGDKRALIIEWPANGPIRNATFFPYAGDNFEIQPQIERLPMDKSRVALRAVVKKFKGDWPSQLAGLIVLKRGEASEAFDVLLTVAHEGSVTVSTGSAGGVPTNHGVGRGLAFHLLLALGGGLVLNLMPCVLPILSLKVLSLVRHSGGSAGERRKHGLVYTLGVLVSFWAIGGLVVAGRLASWGAQFQNPRFIVIMTVLMTLVALSLFGVFEVLLPGSTLTQATQLASKERVAGTFFNGVLAVILGASCTAPLLAAAIGWAISQQPAAILLIFTMIGAGLALPFFLLSFFPSLQTLLPEPGPWMEKLKIAMGFPMLATAVWLLSQTADHFGEAGPLWVGLFLVVLALASWIYGEFVQRGTKRKTLGTVLALVLAVGGYCSTLERGLDWRHPPQDLPSEIASAGNGKADEIPWQPWSPAAVEAARKNGHPVLVDFTANWCLTCQLNKKTSLEVDAVRRKIEQINAVPLLADYTRQNPEIAAELKRFERAGVPLVLVYPRDSSKPPAVLPTVLTPGIVLDALDAAVK